MLGQNLAQYIFYYYHVFLFNSSVRTKPGKSPGLVDKFVMLAEH